MSHAPQSDPARRTTIADIAAAAGCSLMTVSRVLRDHPSVAKATRERVLLQVAALGYRPDPEVSRLMAHLRSSRIAEPSTVAWVVVGGTRSSWRKVPATQAIFAGAQAQAKALGYRLTPFWLGDYGMSAPRLAQVLTHRGIRGLLVAPVPDDGAQMATMPWDGFAAATCGFSLAEPRLHRCSSQQHQAVSLGWRELQRRGYSRVGLALSSDSNRRTGNMWLSGFLACQNEATLQAHSSAPEVALLPPLLLGDSPQTEFANWFRQQRPDALLGTAQVYELAVAAGVNPGRDSAFALLNIIGTKPEVSGVDHHMDALGAAAMDLVAEQLRLHRYGLPAIPKTVMVECDWHEGQTAPALRSVSLSA